MAPDNSHRYFRLNAKGGTGHLFVKELPLFYFVAAHFDGNRNAVMSLMVRGDISSRTQRIFPILLHFQNIIPAKDARLFD